MLSYIINYLQANVETLQYIEKAYGLARIITEETEQLIAKFPGVYEGSELVHVDFDQKNSMLFFILDGDIQRTTDENPYVACTYRINEVFNLKCYIYSQSKEAVNCSSMSQRLAWIISKAITGKHKALMDATGIDFVMMSTTSTSLDKQSIWKELYTAPNSLQDEDNLVRVNIKVEIEGDEKCFVPYPCEVVAVIGAEDDSIIQTQSGSLINATNP